MPSPASRPLTCCHLPLSEARMESPPLLAPCWTWMRGDLGQRLRPGRPHLRLGETLTLCLSPGPAWRIGIQGADPPSWIQGFHEHYC